MENSKDEENILNDNLLFYQNEMPSSQPLPGTRITEMLTWKGDYEKLEHMDSYIEWLFPVPEGCGVKISGQPLQEHEIKEIIEDDVLRSRLLDAFKMMLDFFGMELVDENTGKVQKKEHWKPRYEQLNKCSHYCPHITRILVALGELGFEHLQVPWLEFIMLEATVNQALPHLDVSLMHDWIQTVKIIEEQTVLTHKWQQLNEARLVTPEPK